MVMAKYNQSNFEENEMGSENISSHEPLKDLKSLDFNDMVNVVSYFSMSLGEESSINGQTFNNKFHVRQCQAQIEI